MTADRPGFRTEWPSPEIEALADQLERDIGCTIDRSKFWHDMVAFNGAYQQDICAARVRTAKARAAAEAAYRRCRALRSSLEKAVDAFAPLNDLPAMLADVNRMERAMARQLEFVRSSPPARDAGERRSGWLFETTINRLALVYEDHTGQPAGTSTIRKSDDRNLRDEYRGGPFVRFVASVLDIVEPDRKRAALGDSIAKVLQVLNQPHHGVPRRSPVGDPMRYTLVTAVPSRKKSSR